MRVRLTRKLAECVDGVDLSSYREGDVLALDRHEAELLLAEGWARPLSRGPSPEIRARSALPTRTEAADSPRGVNYQRLRQLQRTVDRSRFESHAHRRVEDRMLEELHDAQARVVNADASETVERASVATNEAIASNSPPKSETRRRRHVHTSRKSAPHRGRRSE